MEEIDQILTVVSAEQVARYLLRIRRGKVEVVGLRRYALHVWTEKTPREILGMRLEPRNSLKARKLRILIVDSPHEAFSLDDLQRRVL